jgi:hypothetical protein
MRIRDALIWATMWDAHPLPAGCPVEPTDWPAWWDGADAAQRDALLAAAVPLLAERWADAMEARLDAYPDLRVADIAAPSFPLRDITIDLTPFHFGGIVALLAASWAHGDDLASWLQVLLHAHRVAV